VGSRDLKFEREFVQYLGARGNALAVTPGRQALQLAEVESAFSPETIYWFIILPRGDCTIVTVTLTSVPGLPLDKRSRRLSHRCSRCPSVALLPTLGPSFLVAFFKN